MKIKTVSNMESRFSVSDTLYSIVKYIALLAMAKIAPSHPHLVAEYQDTIMASVNDQDISIRMRALDLVCAMVSINTTMGALNLTPMSPGEQRKPAIHCPATSSAPRDSRQPSLGFAISSKLRCPSWC